MCGKGRKGIEGEGEKISANAEHVREEAGGPLLFPLASRTSNYLLSLNLPLPSLSAPTRHLATLNKFTQVCLLVTHAITYFLLSLY